MSDEYCTSCGRCKNCGSLRPLGNNMASGAYLAGAGAAQVTVMTIPSATGAAPAAFGCSHIVTLLT